MAYIFSVFGKWPSKVRFSVFGERLRTAIHCGHALYFTFARSPWRRVNDVVTISRLEGGYAKLVNDVQTSLEKRVNHRSLSNFDLQSLPVHYLNSVPVILVSRQYLRRTQALVNVSIISLNLQFVLFRAHVRGRFGKWGSLAFLDRWMCAANSKV